MSNPIKSCLTLHILSTCHQLHIQLTDRVILGRRSEPDSDGISNIDLSPFLGYQLGVSRRHLMLANEKGNILAFDLSTNGSFINNERMSSHQGHVLKDGDELMLGALVIRVYFRSAIPFAHLQTPRPAVPIQTTTPLTGPLPDIRETLVTQPSPLETLSIPAVSPNTSS